MPARSAIPRWLEDQENGLEELGREIEQIARQNPIAMRLQKVRGIGPLTATALLATVGDASQFSNDREMAASFGSRPNKTALEEKNDCLALANEETPICADCSCMAPEQSFAQPKAKQMD